MECQDVVKQRYVAVEEQGGVGGVCPVRLTPVPDAEEK